jgi:iron complex outermembrane receptor protein
LALIYSPTAQTTIKAAYSSAFRLPAAIEKYNFDGNTPGSAIANPALDSEKVTTRELVLRHEIARNFVFTGSLYQYRTEDLIASVGLPTGFRQFVNTGSSHTHGLEMELERDWGNGVRLRTSYAHQVAEDVDGHTAINAPRHLGKFNISFPLLDYRARGGLELQYTGSRLTETRQELGGYTLTNLTLTTERLIPGASVSATLRNLFDKKYSVVAPAGIAPDKLEMDGRTFWLNMSYDFK